MNASSSAVPLRVCTRRALLLAACGMLGTVACDADFPDPTVYGAKVRFSKNSQIVYPDFELTYVGRRHVATKIYPRGFDYDDFKISRGGKSITVSWSAGTGEIGPTLFEFSGHSFTLELRHAGRFKGWLKEDELVIEKK
jgi:hypothetical protein